MKSIDILTRIMVTAEGIELLPTPAPNASTSTPKPYSHSPDFASVVWGGYEYRLTPKQRIVVALLIKSLEQGHRFLSGAYLLDEAGSDSTMGQLFRNNPAWGGLVCQGVLHGGPDGTYCLRPLAA